MKRYRPKHWHYLYELLFPNGKRYVGHGRDAQRRWDEHAKWARLNKRKAPVYDAIRKFGWENVCKRIILIGCMDYIVEMEAVVIEELETTDRRFGYNVAPGGNKSPTANPIVCKKISQSKFRHWQDPEYRAVMLGVLSTYERTPEHNKKNGDAKRISWQNSEWRINQIAKRVGKKDSEETKQLKGESSRQAWRKPERHQRGVEAMLGNDNTLGFVWINNGTERRQISRDIPLPEGWFYGMLATHMNGRKIITNGTSERRIYPLGLVPEGWWFGRRTDVQFGTKPKA